MEAEDIRGSPAPPPGARVNFRSFLGPGRQGLLPRELWPSLLAGEGPAVEGGSLAPFTSVPLVLAGPWVHEPHGRASSCPIVPSLCSG